MESKQVDSMKEKKERNVLIGPRSQPRYKLARVSGPLLYKLKNRTIHDKHCFVCHLECTTIFCTACARSYHASCVGRSKTRKCEQCKSIDKSKLLCQKSNLTPQKLNEILELLLGRFPSRKKLEELNINMDYEYLIEVMHPNTIDLKVFDSKYESCEHFMSDVKRLLHNCYIMHSDNDEIIKLVESFAAFCEDEMYDIGLCVQCYERKCSTGISNVITDVCAVPHLVVWAQLKGYPYWPAKVIAVTKRRCEVIFFGQHDTAKISQNNCKLFSKESPNAQLESNYEKDFHDSYTEALQYIENVKDQFGTYHVPTLPAKFCAKQLNEQRAIIIQSIQNGAAAEQTKPHSSNNNIETSSMIPYFEATSNEVFI